jgi:hypothetical protein
MKNKYNKINFRSISYSLLFLFFLVFPVNAWSASLYFSPSSFSNKVGDTFTVNLNVNTSDQFMNAASGVVSFPSDKLEVVSLTKGGSIFSLWVQEPSFSNTTGRINFEGIVLNPGFKGSGGRLLSATFKSKKSGDATISLISGLVLANDGQGTNITSGLGKASVKISQADTAKPPTTTPEKPTSPEVVAPTTDSRAPKISKIVSLNHPDPDSWYNNNTANFSWNTSNDVRAIKLILNNSANSSPSVVYRPAISSRQIENLADGVWYFAIQAENSFGWGPIERTKIQIDTTRPENLSVSEVERANSASPDVGFIIKSSDAGSGISHYEITINDQPEIIWKDDGSNLFKFSGLGSGNHKLTIKAVDRAGNSLIDIINFDIDNLNPPIINDWSAEITNNDYLIIRGETEYPNSKIILHWQSEDGEEISTQVYQSNSEGKFVIVTKDISDFGKYNFWLTAEDDQGLVSIASEKITVNVQKDSFFQSSSRSLASLKVFIPLIILIIISIIFVLYFGYNYFIFKRGINNKVKTAGFAVNHTLTSFYDDFMCLIADSKKVSSKKPSYSLSEKKLEKIKKDFSETKKAVNNEINKIKEK